MTEYFSDRELGPRPRVHEPVPPAVWGGLCTHVESRIASGAFGLNFPEECSDGEGICGVNESSMGRLVLAEIPELAAADVAADQRPGRGPTGWPLMVGLMPPTMAVLDLVEFCFQQVAEPTQVGYHSYYRHHHLTFDRRAGQAKWCADINRLFSRNGLAYELTSSGRVLRLGTPVLTEAVRSSAIATGDDELDDLLTRAVAKYLSIDSTTRSESLEQLWDAFERSKTIHDSNKKLGAQALLDGARTSVAMGERLSTEAKALTEIGNTFRIRHHETDKSRVSAEDVDYLFHRCFAFLALVLGLNPR